MAWKMLVRAVCSDAVVEKSTYDLFLQLHTMGEALGVMRFSLVGFRSLMSLAKLVCENPVNRFRIGSLIWPARNKLIYALY